MSALGERGTVTSADGTVISTLRRGSGPPLVVVHAMLADADNWRLVSEQLGGRLTVVSYDRRGRGESGPGAEPYSLARELDDLAAVLATAGPGATLLGHSFGGTVALEYARTAPAGTFERLVLYEPAVGPVDPAAPAALAACRQLLDAGRDEDAMQAGLERLSSLRPPEVAVVRSSPLWPEFVARAGTFVREQGAVQALAAGAEPYAPYAAIAAPTLLLLGERSVARAHETTAALAAVLPRARVVTLPGEGHVANVAAPARVADALLAFAAAAAPTSH